MNSSGMKRGLAATAISALAVTGLPFLATSASATTVASTFVNPDATELYGPAETAFVSTKNDGTNTTVSLLAGGGSNVTSILFQYKAASTLGAWVDVPGGLVARNADGVFKFDWANPPADLSEVQAVANTSTSDNQVVTLASSTAATTATVELGTEGNLGYFLSPYAAADDVDGTAGADNKNGQYIVAKGTTSGATTAVTINQASHEAQTNVDSVNTTSADADGEGAGTTGAFAAIMDITGYQAAGGGDANQLVLNAETTGVASNTDDAEGSTLYNQVITTVTATPETQDSPGTAGSEVTIKVTDQNGAPVANAQVGRYIPDDASDADTAPQDAGTGLGYTNAKGELKVTQTYNGAVTYYANTTDNNPYDAGVDPSDTASITQYTPVVSQVVIKSRDNRTSFDLDELLDGDEFTIETLDQKGKKFNEDNNATNNDSNTEVEYRWIIDPTAAGEPTLTQDWQTDAADTGSVFTVPALLDGDLVGEFRTPAGALTTATDLPVGTYTLEARRPNAGLSGGLVNATPIAYTMGESEVTFDEGSDVTAPAGGSTTVSGKLALTNSGPGLGGRELPVTYAPGTGNAALAPQSEQPAGVTITGANTADVVTAADGSFSIKLKDQAFPTNVPPTGETGTLSAGPAEESATDTTDLADTNGPGAADAAGSDATGSIVVNWTPAPTATDIQISTDVLDAYSVFGANDQAAPGSPVDLDITVFQADGSDANSDPDPIKDYPVTITVDKGFLSPNAETEDALKLDADHDDADDQWGFFQSLGGDEQVSTGDASQAGIVAAMESDAGLADDGRSTMKVTVKAGDVTETVDITFDVRNFLNLQDGSLERAAGEPMGDVPVTEDVDFQLYVHDQFGNLVGDHNADIEDDSTIADFMTDGDFGATQTDFATSGAGIRAMSDAETVQTLFARMASQEVMVDGADAGTSPDRTTGLTELVASDPINWVAAGTKESPELVLKGRDNGGKADRLKADARGIAAGAEVSLFKKTANGWKKIREGVLNAKGNKSFKVADKNGKKATKYKAVVKGNDAVRGDSDTKRVR